MNFAELEEFEDSLKKRAEGSGGSASMYSRYHAFVIPHSAQRYNTVGDYYSPYPSSLELRISDLENTDYEFLVLIHELVEAYLCAKRGISEPEITAFDMAFRGAGGPGNRLDAPYHKEHVFAENIERQIAAEMGVDWETYSVAVDAICEAGKGPDPEQETEPMSASDTNTGSE